MPTRSEEVAGSFRDPFGFMFEEEGTLYRQVNPAGAEGYGLLRTSGLYQRLTDAGRLVSHEEVPALASARGAHQVLRPQRVPFISYPYEWSFGQLQAAALLTLQVLGEALEHGLILRDASAYNVQFLGSRPVFIDTLSFERYQEGLPWVAYRQFCQHFLAPLALMARVDVRLGSLLRSHLDGVPLDLASRLLPWSTRARFSLAVHIHAHARSQAAHADDAAQTNAAPRPRRGMSKTALRGLIDNLQSAVQAQQWAPSGTEWAEYYETSGYTDASLESKREGVRQLLEAMPPARTVWDLGANRGVFSQLAAQRGAYVLAFDVDPAAVEKAFRAGSAEGEERILPLVLDLTNPSGPLGWAHQERLSLLERGPADVVLGLALIHHLAIGNNLPLGRVARFLADAAPRAIVEWVPKSDPQVRRLLASREDIFPGYTQDGFEAAMGERFRIVQRVGVTGTDRALYSLERK